MTCSNACGYCGRCEPEEPEMDTCKACGGEGEIPRETDGPTEAALDAGEVLEFAWVRCLECHGSGVTMTENRL